MLMEEKVMEVMEETSVIEEMPVNEEDANEYVIRFSKPYTFEEETYVEIDLSNIESVTALDMIAAQKVINKSGEVTPLPEMSLEYACVIAARVSKKPIEFFKNLPAREAIKLKNLVTGFLFGAD